MPNQLNYSSQIPTPYTNVRPDRIQDSERSVMSNGSKQVLFGTTPNDVVEIWFYDSNGAVAGHLNLPPDSPLVALSTIVDNSGNYELLNIDMGQVTRLLTLDSGRYGLVVNFFRNEVGSEDGRKFYISEISEDRTELKLYPKSFNPQWERSVFEWAVPSVPKLEAKGLIDQTFGESLDAGQAEIVDAPKIMAELDNVHSNTSTRVTNSGTRNIFDSMIQQILDEAYVRTLNKMAADTGNLYIQQVDLERYMRESITEVIHVLKSAGTVDNRFDIT